MAACKWDLRRSFQVSLSGSNLIATSTQAGVWQSIFGTTGASATYPGGRYFEVVLGSVPSSLMIGIAKVDAPTRSAYNTSLAWQYQTEGHVWHAGSYSTLGATYGNGDRIGILVKNGKLYIRKNGTWQNAGDPDAETGWVATGITGTVYPIVSFYGTETATLHCGSTITGSLPTGVHRWDQAVTVSCTLVDPDTGNPIAAQAVKWSVFAAATPDAFTEVDAAGTGTTNGEGVLDITYHGTPLEDGDTGGVLISTTGGVAGEQCKSCYVPIVVSVAP